MSLETATYINTLDATQPTGSDMVASLDDHIRLVKQVIKATFPNVTGAVPYDHNHLGIPAGFIGMWSGTIATIPSGWVLCDGNNGTPNLLNRMVIGAGTVATNGALYAPGATGGSKDSIVPAHTHTFSGNTGIQSNDHVHVGTTDPAGAHQHSFLDGYFAENNGINNGVIGSGQTDGDNHIYERGALTDWVGNHQHSFTTSGMSANHTHTFSGTTASTGVSATDANLPPYYALAFIMKT